MQDKPKPPMKCVPIGKNFPPNEGADKWVLKKDHTVEVLVDEFKTIAEGGWRNKVDSLCQLKHLFRACWQHVIMLAICDGMQESWLQLGEE